MSDLTLAPPPAAGSGGTARRLPDVNAETYPYDFVQHLLDQTANFVLLAVPDAQPVESFTPDHPDDYFGLTGGYGIAIRSCLRRLEATAQAPDQSGLEVEQRIGEAVGTLAGHWLFAPDDAPWAPGRQPPPAIFDPWRAQRFTMLDAVFTLGDDGFTGYGVGRTFPTFVEGRKTLLAGAVGNVVEGRGRFHGLAGTFVLTGTLTPELGFLGNVTCRIVDPEGRLRTTDEIPALSPAEDPDPTSTFLILRGEKRDRTVRTTFGVPPDAERVSLVTPSQLRAMRYELTRQGHRGLRVASRVHQVVGSMVADVAFNLLAPPGTAEAPVPFSTAEAYTFVDRAGATVGTISAGVVEGISFDLKFPAAPGQPGVRFAGFGPITGGSGAFAGAQGMLTVNSLIGIAPHALSLLHVLHMIDPPGQLRTAGTRPSRRPQNLELVRQLREGDPFYDLKRRKEEHTPVYLRWREGFRRCSRAIAEAVAAAYGERRCIGEFPGLPMSAEALEQIFAGPIAPFNPEVMDRYRGPAKGTFRFYSLADARELDTSALYSVWNPRNMEFDDGRIAKRISGSFERYYDPESLPRLSDGKVDIILNSYRRDVGITSWVEIYQKVRQQRTSIAYKLPRPHEVLWFVKDISLNGKAIENDVFMASHEWKGSLRGKPCYFLIGIWFEIDFERCTIRLSGDRFWRALYEEEPGAMTLGK